jgi:hypothetical protein
MIEPNCADLGMTPCTFCKERQRPRRDICWVIWFRHQLNSMLGSGKKDENRRQFKQWLIDWNNGAWVDDDLGMYYLEKTLAEYYPDYLPTFNAVLLLQ